MSVLTTLDYAWRHGRHPAVRFGHRWLDTRLRRRVPFALSHAAGRRLTVAYGGVAHGLGTLLPLLELQRTAIAGETSARSTGLVGWASLRTLSEVGPADLVVAGGDARWVSGLPLRSALVLPYRVHLVVETGGAPDAVRRRISRREREMFAHNARVHGWSWQRDTSTAAFDLFYERMHVPTMRRRHGERARSERREVAEQCILRRGHLFFVVEGGRPVAGALCRWDARSGTLTMRLLGVLDGADEHYASGAFKAVYHFLIHWAVKAGVQRVDLSGAEPVLSMGIVQWKRRFGAAMVLPPNHFRDKRIWLHVVRDSAAVRDFLAANPLVAMTADEALEAVYFADGDRPARRDILGDFAGVRGPRIVDLDRFLGGEEGASALVRDREPDLA